jgi:putative isomerase
MAYLAQCLHLDPQIAKGYTDDAQQLKTAIQTNCWDERDGFYYSVDLNLLPIKTKPEMRLGLNLVLHSGHPRDYNCLIQRIGEWSGFMAMWAGIATPEQAKRMVNEHYKNEKTFNAPYGIRSLSKMEKMYSTYASSNPSNWQGPVWGISNYMVFMGLNSYGYKAEAREMATKTIALFGNDCKINGAFHEYYDPDSGKPIVNKGFQSWNYLVTNMIAWLQNDKVIKEF